MPGAERININGYPYTIPEVVEVDGNVLLSFQVWSFLHGDLIDKSVAILEGKPLTAKLQEAGKHAESLTKMLHEGYTVGDPRNMGLLAGVKLGARKKIMVIGVRGKERYRSFVNVFSEWLEHAGRTSKLLKDTTRRDMYDFLDWLKEHRGVGNYTRNNYLYNIRSCFTELCAREMLSKNPTEGITKLNVQSSKYPFFTEKQQKILERWMKLHNRNLYHFTRFIYYGFMRPAEIKRLRIQDINMKDRVIMVWNHVSKNKKQQPVVINNDLYNTLQAMEIEDVPAYWYLFGPQWDPAPEPCTSRHKFGNAHRKAMEETKLYDGILDMYSWKNTGMSRAFDAGVDIIQIKNQARHHSLDQSYDYMKALGKVIHSGLKDKEW